MTHHVFDDTADLAAREALIGLFLPLAMTLETDHFRVFLEVCGEDGISLQKLGRLTNLGQSEVIRATSMLESWRDKFAVIATDEGLLYSQMEIAKGYRRQSFLTAQGIALRDRLIQAFGLEHYGTAALDLHGFIQQELQLQVGNGIAQDTAHDLPAAKA